jgi:EAL domain-containing protein (putative c-di-GMP-specific phosphodiesterase class I)/PAS domain-containing protein
MNLIRRLLAFIYRRPIQHLLSVLATLVVGALLIVTIRFTLFDLQWLTFLGGILFAAILSLASQASKSEWLIARRTRQLERIKEQLDQEKTRGRVTEETLRAMETRALLVHDMLPLPILYIDRDLRIRQHNRPFLKLTDWPADRIDGQLLRDVSPREYASLLPRFHETLAGNLVSYSMPWLASDGTPANYLVKQVPYAPEGKPVQGFYILMLPEHGAPGPAAASAPPVSSAPYAAITDDSGETLYLHSLSDQLKGSEDPAEKLVRALQNNEFLLYTQKILPLKPLPFDHGCYEILLRLQEEEDNLLPPGGFIPIAERYGLTEEIDRWVVRRLITWCGERQKTVPDWPIPLFCVNLSEASISNPEFARFVRLELQRSEFPAKQLCFEIGELETISSHDNVARFIAALKPAGCRFTADGFGSVKLSFSNLSGLAVNFIKIDGVIIQNMFKTPADLKKLQAILGVCQKLGVQTIAEFVEDDTTLKKLRELGVDYAQGFGIAKPLPVTKIP